VKGSQQSDKTVCLSGGKKKTVLDRSGKLMVLSGPMEGREFILGEELSRIGSSAENDIVVEDRTVSRRHCEIRRTAAGYVVRDLGSTNGTRVDEVEVSEALLDHGAEVCMGDTSLILCSLRETKQCILARRALAKKRLNVGLAIQKFSRNGIGYSIAEWSDVRHVFAAAVPRRGKTLAEQADDALRTIETVNGVHGTHKAIVHQAVFLPDPALIDECRSIMRAFYGSDLPVTSYIAQPPCEGKLLAIEALGLGTGRGEVEIERMSEQLLVARHNGMVWTHAAPVVSRAKGLSAYDQGCAAFGKLQALLAGANVRMDQVLRTWLYQGGIVADEGDSQRYKELNRARADIYQDIRFLTDLLPKGHAGSIYPASTGIGTEGRGLELSAIALATDRLDVVAVPLENPRQTSAYGYGAHYSPKSPKFSRGMALSCGKYAMIFISGTASITASETRHVGDATAQTRETLDNISALISEENLARHGFPGMGTTLGGLGLARVYIKRREDYAQVRAVCDRMLGELPTIYAIADVCRPDLLVEIEGIALSQRCG
jgi:pSer/pThr/pTyr-binding forkhead associated (FHA) protein